MQYTSVDIFIIIVKVGYNYVALSIKTTYGRTRKYHKKDPRVWTKPGIITKILW